MSLPDRREDPNATFTFREAEQIFEQELPISIKILSSSEAQLAKREYIYHYIALKLADEEGILDADPESAKDYPVITKTLNEWHALWANALEVLTSDKTS
jgi:hypothetical protein